VPEDDEYDDEGTRIWISMAVETRLAQSHVVGERPQKSDDRLVIRTAQYLKALPLFVTDGLSLIRSLTEAIRQAAKLCANRLTRKITASQTDS